MKKTLLAAFVAGFLAFAGSGWATPITIDRIANYYSGVGGEFNIAGLGAATNSLYAPSTLVNNRYGVQGFETFCLEYYEYVSIPGSYNAVINPNNKALGGGYDTNPDVGDTISRGTAYLYYQFSQGALADYNYIAGAGRIASAAALQQTIWWLEDESSTLPTTFQTLLTHTFGSLANAKLNIDKDYGVGVLNLTTASGGAAQDQLVRTPTSVPEPSTILLLGLALVGLAGIRTKRKG